MMNLIKQGKWGMWLSGLCAIHCMLTPIVVVALPFAGASFLESHTTEYVLLSIGFVFSMSTVVNSYLKVHRNILIVIATLLGFTLVVIAHLFSSAIFEAVLSVVGSLFIIVALFKNQSLIKSCNCA
jgi:hypothetical protein